MPKYCEIWDIHKVLKFYEEEIGHTDFNVADLTQKLCMSLVINCTFV